LDRGELADSKTIGRATIATLNLPFNAFIRVTLVHGPMAGLSVMVLMLGGNWLFHADFQPWQFLIFFVLILVFASPAHAIFEFFAVSKAVQPVLERLSRAGREVGREYLKQLKSTSIRNKLLYLVIFVSALPLVFFAASVIFKVYRLLHHIGVEAPATEMKMLVEWVVGVVVVSMLGAFLLAILTSREVSRNAAKLVDAMRTVERGDLQVHLEVTGTDEYADLFRGFNLMTEGLREEVQILETSQALMGELNLDKLLQRIIRATTQLLDADRTTLFLHDRKTNELWSRYAEGMNRTREVSLREASLGSALERNEIRFPANQGIAGAVFTTGKVENIADPQNDPRFNSEIDRKTGYRTESILAIPITTKFGERIGVVQVLNKNGGQFMPKDEARLRAFTAQIAVALENARLFEDVLRMKNYNESILRSTSNGMMTLDVERSVQTANEAALRILRKTFDDVQGVKADDVFAENPWVVHSIEKVELSGQTDISVDSDLRVGDSTASVNLTAVPLIDATQAAKLGLLLIIEDISSEKRLKSTMSRYMSKEVADQLLEGGEAVLGGKVQRVSVLFSDIRSFTTVSESIGAKETVSMLNEYFEEMVDVIFRNKGILDKYIGDAIMALFGAPFNTPRDPDHAVAAANEMMVTLRYLNQRRRAKGKDPIDIGVGISTGDVVVGNIGSPKRMEYTAIGDSVNLASRLEGATKMYGVKILMSEFTARDIAVSWRTREVDKMRVKGKLQPVAVCEALDHHDEESFPNMEFTLEHYNRGLEFYCKREWTAAVKAFQAALQANPHDKPSKIHLERCLHYVSTPPPVEWDGVWTLTEK
ncbi:MAG: adenylate/guanylate cyclase domain-containing protein, partial [Thermoanaerobaculia bacterium]